jgi:hypothetical protein
MFWTEFSEKNALRILRTIRFVGYLTVSEIIKATPRLPRAIP